MRVFHVKVFDDMVEGAAAVYTSPQFDDLLTSPSTLLVVAVVTTVSGTGPTLTVGVEQSPDRRNWIPADVPQIDGSALTAGTVNLLGGDPAAPGTGWGRLKIQLGGTSPKAQITLWATGHDDNPFV